MENSKLIQLLKTMKGENWNRLHDFVRSPYFNKNEELILFFEYIRSLYPDFSSRRLLKEHVFEQVFPGKPFNKKQFNHLQNYLLRLVEQFLAHQLLKEDLIEQGKRNLNYYLETRLEKHYDFKRGQLKRKLEAAQYRDEDFFYSDFSFSKIENERFIIQRQRIADETIQNASEALDTFYAIQKLKFLAEILDRQKKFPQSYTIYDFETLYEQVQQKKYQDTPYVQVYLQLVQMLLEEENSAHYDRFRALLEQSIQELKPKDLKRLFLFAINYCVRKIAAGHAFHDRLLNLYTSGLENGTLLEYGTLSPWTYKNVIQLGLALGKMEWVEQFIDLYVRKLPLNYREDAFHYNMAALYYAKEDYKHAMLYLNRVQYSDVAYKLWSKELLLKIYFELEEYEAHNSLLISFEQLIKRNKQIPKPQREAYKNFIRIMGKLVRRKHLPKQLIHEIESLPYLRERKWLLTQLRK